MPLISFIFITFTLVVPLQTSIGTCFVGSHCSPTIQTLVDLSRTVQGDLHQCITTESNNNSGEICGEESCERRRRSRCSRDGEICVDRRICERHRRRWRINTPNNNKGEIEKDCNVATLWNRDWSARKRADTYSPNLGRNRDSLPKLRGTALVTASEKTVAKKRQEIQEEEAPGRTRSSRGNPEESGSTHPKHRKDEESTSATPRVRASEQTAAKSRKENQEEETQRGRASRQTAVKTRKEKQEEEAPGRTKSSRVKPEKSGSTPPKHKKDEDSTTAIPRVRASEQTAAKSRKEHQEEEAQRVRASVQATTKTRKGNQEGEAERVRASEQTAVKTRQENQGRKAQRCTRSCRREPEKPRSTLLQQGVVGNRRGRAVEAPLDTEASGSAVGQSKETTGTETRESHRAKMASQRASHKKNMGTENGNLAPIALERIFGGG